MSAIVCKCQKCGKEFGKDRQDPSELEICGNCSQQLMDSVLKKELAEQASPKGDNVSSNNGLFLCLRCGKRYVECNCAKDTIQTENLISLDVEKICDEYFNYIGEDYVEHLRRILSKYGYSPLVPLSKETIKEIDNTIILPFALDKEIVEKDYERYKGFENDKIIGEIQTYSIMCFVTKGMELSERKEKMKKIIWFVGTKQVDNKSSKCGKCGLTLNSKGRCANGVCEFSKSGL